jgi:hypothetical protein
MQERLTNGIVGPCGHGGDVMQWTLMGSSSTRLPVLLKSSARPWPRPAVDWLRVMRCTAQDRRTRPHATF